MEQKKTHDFLKIQNYLKIKELRVLIRYSPIVIEKNSYMLYYIRITIIKTMNTKINNCSYQPDKSSCKSSFSTLQIKELNENQAYNVSKTISNIVAQRFNITNQSFKFHLEVTHNKLILNNLGDNSITSFILKEDNVEWIQNGRAVADHSLTKSDFLSETSDLLKKIRAVWEANKPSSSTPSSLDPSSAVDQPLFSPKAPTASSTERKMSFNEQEDLERLKKEIAVLREEVLGKNTVITGLTTNFNDVIVQLIRSEENQKALLEVLNEKGRCFSFDRKNLIDLKDKELENQEKINSLLEKLSAKKEKQNKLKEEIFSLRSELEKLSESKTKLENKEAEIGDLQEKIASLQALANQNQKLISAHSEELSVKQQNYQILQNEHLLLQDELSLEKKNTTQTTTSLNEELSKSKTEIDALQETVASLQALANQKQGAYHRPLRRTL